MGYLLGNPEVVLPLVWQHLSMTLTTLGIAVVVSVPVTLLVTTVRWLQVPILGLLGVLYTIPSLALIIFLVPLFGLNATSVVVAMVLYTQVILVRNLTVGLEGIDPAVLEASRGMGMDAWQRWWWVQVPLVLPVFLAGLRMAAVVSIAIATIGAKFNAGGLGRLLFDGIQTNRLDKIWAGAIAVAILALGVNTLLLWLEHHSRRDKL
ncbi:ABC transporter permease [Leptolyngbya sp. PCC 6406]|uniref:ABC transporter permease n=1 Tax=Leptolyngbya sp. PCC 6406 TaxID=1173264 RepID=UPI0002ABB668|nr:ABC transporter permease [Leptolyngbya sp. PCC 6406]